MYLKIFFFLCESLNTKQKSEAQGQHSMATKITPLSYLELSNIFIFFYNWLKVIQKWNPTYSNADVPLIIILEWSMWMEI